MKKTEDVFRQFINKYLIIDQYDSEEEIDKGKLKVVCENEYLEFLQLNEGLHEYLVLSRKIDEVYLNLKDVYERIEYYKEAVKVGNNLEQGQTQKLSFIDINRVFTNFIVSFKSLIEDYILNHHLTKHFSYKPELKTNFKLQTNNWYDNLFSYRFIIRMRDYAVHVNLPIQIISRSAPPLTNPTDSRIETFSPKFRKSTLLDNEVVRSKLASDFTSLNEEFELFPILNEIEIFINDLKKNTLLFMDNKYLIIAVRLKAILASVPNHRMVSFCRVVSVNGELNMGRTLIQEDIVDEIIGNS